MSSSNSPALVLELPSSWRRLIPAGMLLFVVMLLPWLAFAGTPAMAISVMSGGVALAIFAGWQAGIGSAARRLARVTWSQSGEWCLQFAAGEAVIATLAPSSWWLPWLMCWRWVDKAGRRQGLLLWRYEVSPDSWRQWQLRLRLDWADTPTVMDSLK